MTKQQSLEYCYDLWSWLARNPGKRKDAWPGWGDLGYCQHACPCCEYQSLQNRSFRADLCCTGGHWVKTCPLYSFWPSGCCNSSFALWENALLNKYYDEACNYAFDIANAAKTELAKLISTAPAVTDGSTALLPTGNEERPE